MAPRGRTNLASLAERLRLTREALALSQAELCRRSGIAPQAWNNYETARKRISVDNAIKLRAATGIPLDWVYCADMRSVPLEIATKLQALYSVMQKQGRLAS